MIIKYLLAFLLLLTTPAYADIFAANISGSIVDGASTTVAGTLQYDSKESDWQKHVITDFLYSNPYKGSLHGYADISTKINYKLNDINYLQSGLRGEYDNKRRRRESVTFEIGNGVKILDNKYFKVSNEFGVGIHKNDTMQSLIISDSFWFTWYITSKLEFVNRFLIEQGIQSKYTNDSYRTNVAILSYKLSPGLAVTIQNKYKKEEYVNNTTTLLGLTLKL